MDTIIFLKIAGERDGLPPVFTIRQNNFDNYRMIIAFIPHTMLNKPPSIPKAKHKSIWSRFLRKQQLSEEDLKTVWIQELSEYLKPYLSAACYSICDDSVEKWLRKENLTEWWSRNWPVCEFTGYREWYLADELLREARKASLPAHFLVLGYEDCVPGLINTCVRQMKSLRFVLTGPCEPLQDYLEELCEEYGLAANVQLLQQEDRQKGPFYHYPVVCTCPSVILDFTGEDMLYTADTAKGSIWLDMDSMEKKRRRIEDRDTGIRYFSMKKKWKKVDTTSKNGYNT